MQIRCPHCHTIFSSDATGYCCAALQQELERLVRASKRPANSRWLWNCQHTVDWVPAAWIEMANLATAPGHYYSWWCNCAACSAVRTARGYSFIQREAYREELEKPKSK